MNDLALGWCEVVCTITLHLTLESYVSFACQAVFNSLVELLLCYLKLCDCRITG